MGILLSILLLIQHSPAQMRLANVQIKGNQPFTLPDIEKLTGLEIGKTAGPTDLTDAASKLAKTGLFSNVKYTYATAGTQLNVTFEVEEAPSNIPAIFDNFVWMSDDELESALREYVPEFDGTTTVYAGAADLIVSALQHDDAAHSAAFAFNIREGAEYTMGTLQFVGIRDADAARLSKEWRIKPGDVFDVEYMYQYNDDVLGRLQSASGKHLVIQMVLDREHHVANLRVDLR